MEQLLGNVVTLSIVAERLVEFIVVPIWERYELDRFWLKYVGLLAGAGLVALSGANVFVELLPGQAIAGRVLTAVVAGGGANLLHDLFDFGRVFAEGKGE